MSQEYGYESTSISTDTIETVIGAQTTFKGKVKTANPIRIDGIFEGEIESTDLIVVTETGRLKGTVSCREIHLYGLGEGQLVCTQLCNIKAGAVFKGDLKTGNIVTVPGSILDGTCRMLCMQQQK